jgi:hypothetical protein
MAVLLCFQIRVPAEKPLAGTFWRSASNVMLHLDASLEARSG